MPSQTLHDAVDHTLFLPDPGSQRFMRTVRYTVRLADSSPRRQIAKAKFKEALTTAAEARGATPRRSRRPCVGAHHGRTCGMTALLDAAALALAESMDEEPVVVTSVLVDEADAEAEDAIDVVAVIAEPSVVDDAVVDGESPSKRAPYNCKGCGFPKKLACVCKGQREPSETVRAPRKRREYNPLTAEEAKAQAVSEGLALIKSKYGKSGYAGVLYDDRKSAGSVSAYSAYGPGSKEKGTFLGCYATAEEAALARSRHTGDTVEGVAPMGRNSHASHTNCVMVCRGPLCGGALVCRTWASRIAAKAGRTTYAAGDGCAKCNVASRFNRWEWKRNQTKMIEELLQGERRLIAWPSGVGVYEYEYLGEAETRAAAEAALAVVHDMDETQHKRFRPLGEGSKGEYTCRRCGQPKRGHTCTAPDGPQPAPPAQARASGRKRTPSAKGAMVAFHDDDDAVVEGVFDGE